jgi:hypothetical protein
MEINWKNLDRSFEISVLRILSEIQCSEDFLDRML